MEDNENTNTTTEQTKYTNTTTPKTVESIAALTPSKVEKQYIIPIYQRLFEWDEQKIEQLLDDLYNSYNASKDKPYYIGMLTSTNGNELVDGQQRFTVMMLMGIVFAKEYPEWKSFITVKDGYGPRLHFKSRPDDEAYLKFLIDNFEHDDTNKVSPDKTIIENIKMKKGIECIKNWIDKNLDDSTRKDFLNYVYNNLTFFVAPLPYNNGKELNKYFEAMNSTGRNLENHEILKVNLLKELNVNNDSEIKTNATRIWNLVESMDKSILHIIKKEDYKDDSIIQKIKEIIKNNPDDLNLLQITESKGDASNIGKTILAVAAENKKPQRHLHTESHHNIVSFSTFLLLVLYITVQDKKENNWEPSSADAFFDVQKLLETFNILENDKLIAFYKNLLIYRIILDYFVIKIPNQPGEDYKLVYKDNNDEDNMVKKLMQFQSMLYCTSSSRNIYKWLVPYMRYLKNNIDNLNGDSLLKELKKIDNESYKVELETINNIDTSKEKIEVEPEFLSYGKVTQYWFRRLDYYIWEASLDNRLNEYICSVINPNLEVIKEYRFTRGGQSIEHLYPQDGSAQNESNDANKEWEKMDGNNPDYKHFFGNLCLISSSFNSAQSNDPLGVKFARIKEQIDNKRLESLKMYLMYLESGTDGKGWIVETMKKHENKMIELLKDSYKDCSNNTNKNR